MSRIDLDRIRQGQYLFLYGPGQCPGIPPVEIGPPHCPLQYGIPGKEGIPYEKAHRSGGMPRGVQYFYIQSPQMQCLAIMEGMLDHNGAAEYERIRRVYVQGYMGALLDPLDPSGMIKMPVGQ